MGDQKRICVLGGGTIEHVANHFALCAPAFGQTARDIRGNLICCDAEHKMEVKLYLTDMAGGSDNLRTNSDVEKLVDELVADDRTKIIFFTTAMCDFEGNFIGRTTQPSKRAPRPSSRKNQTLLLAPTKKVISKIREKRKDIFLVGFKSTTHLTEDEQYIMGLNLCKEASCNLVLANDSISRLNMVITPEEARYHVTTDRKKALDGLCEMALLRSHLTFTRSTVISGEPVYWNSELVPISLRAVVNHCIEQGAYKEFRGATVGHFAHKLDETTFLTSIRRTNFNDLNETGLVKVETDGPESVMAYGAKPSVGGQSQRIVFHEHQDYDCIVHFHCPIKEKSEVPIASQREFECGSHECGQNTSTNLKKFGNLSAVYLEEHGPNIVFNQNIDPREVIQFIDDNFDLSRKTGGFVSVQSRLDTNSTADDAQALL